MRGADEQSGSMFSYVSLEERVPPDHPLRAIRRITDRALEATLVQVRDAVYQLRSALDRARETVAGAAAAGNLHDSQRKPAADGYGEREAAVAMISGLGGRRCTVAADNGYDSRVFFCFLRSAGDVRRPRRPL